MMLVIIRYLYISVKLITVSNYMISKGTGPGCTQLRSVKTIK